MKTLEIIKYTTYQEQTLQSNLEDALQHAARRYSVKHLAAAGIHSQEEIMMALEKAIQVCALAGIDSKIHFKKIYVYDTDRGTTYSDWLMTKKGLHLVLLQFPLLNEFIAKWLLQFAE